MASLRQLYVTLELRAQDFNNALRQAGAEAKQFQKDVKPTTDFLKDMGIAAKDMGIVLTAALTAPIGAVAAFGLSMNALVEQTQIAFTTLLGDGHKAEVFLEELKDFAAKTPFEFPDLIRGTQRLMAMGIQADDTKRILTAVGDAAAGLGGNAEIIDRITIALSQMAGRGRIATQEMNQLTEARIPAWEILGKAMNKTQAELRDLVEKGAVPAAKAIEQLVDGMNARFGGMMAKQAETFNGLISTIRDESRFLAGELTEGLFNALKGPIKTLTDALHNLRVSVGGWSDETKAAITVIGVFAAALGPVLFVTGTLARSISDLIILYGKLAPAIEASATAQKLLNAAMLASPWVIAVGAGIALGVAMVELSDKIEHAAVVTRLHSQDSKEQLGIMDQMIKRTHDQEDVMGLLTAQYYKHHPAQARHVELTKEQKEELKKFNAEVDKMVAGVIGSTRETDKLTSALEKLRAAKVPTTLITKEFASRLKEEEERSKNLKQPLEDIVLTHIKLLHAHELLEKLKSPLLVDPDVVRAQQEFYGKNMELVRRSLTETVALSIMSMDGVVAVTKAQTEDSKKAFDDFFAHQTKVFLESADIERVVADKKQEEMFKRAEEYKKVWTEAVGGVTKDLVQGLADVIFAGKNFGDAMVNIAKTTAKSMFEAFLTGLLAPLTTKLAGLGATLASKLGIGGPGASNGGIFGGGGILNMAGGGLLSSIFGGGSGIIGHPELISKAPLLPIGGLEGLDTAGAGAGGGAVGAGGLLGLGSATIPAIGAAIGVVTALASQIGAGRRTANEFVQNFQNPFAEFISGVSDVQAFDAAVKEFWTRADEWVGQSTGSMFTDAFSGLGNRQIVEQQAHQTLDDFLTKRRADLAAQAPIVNNFEITQQPDEDLGALVNRIILYLQGNSGAAGQLNDTLPDF